MIRDRDFDAIVKDFGGGSFPPDLREFDKSPGGSVWPNWSVLILGALMGFIASNLLMYAPILLPSFLLVVLAVIVTVAIWKRWR